EVRLHGLAYRRRCRRSRSCWCCARSSRRRTRACGERQEDHEPTRRAANHRPPYEPAARFFPRAFSCSILRGTSQPPLPLHAFLPAQPLSPLAQPPSALHVFWPLHECRATSEAHPPLPLQSFLPTQPLLPQPCLHEPWPLHSLRPLQTCFGFLGVSSAPSRAP